jgi:hypothetical protein
MAQVAISGSGTEAGPLLPVLPGDGPVWSLECLEGMVSLHLHERTQSQNRQNKDSEILHRNGYISTIMMAVCKLWLRVSMGQARILEKQTTSYFIQENGKNLTHLQPVYFSRILAGSSEKLHVAHRLILNYEFQSL